jgi:hypothetical protein
MPEVKCKADAKLVNQVDQRLLAHIAAAKGLAALPCRGGGRARSPLRASSCDVRAKQKNAEETAARHAFLGVR